MKGKSLGCQTKALGSVLSIKQMGRRRKWRKDRKQNKQVNHTQRDKVEKTMQEMVIERQKARDKDWRDRNQVRLKKPAHQMYPCLLFLYGEIKMGFIFFFLLSPPNFL